MIPPKRKPAKADIVRAVTEEFSKGRAMLPKGLAPAKHLAYRLARRKER